jgi:hypothetical protein
MFAMKYRRMTTLTVAATMAIGGVMSTAPSAEAAPFAGLIPSTFVTKYQTLTVPALGGLTAEAPCPAGMKAISAGGLGTVLSGITPGPGYDSGTATARAGANEGGNLLVAQVTCAPAVQLAGATFATREQSAHSTVGEWSQTVNCPAGMRAFGGGGYFRAKNGARSTDPYFLSAETLTSNGRSWRVSALNNTFSDTLVVTTRCAPQSSSTRVVEEIFPIVPQPPATVGRVSGYAHCPDGFTPISGGAEVTGDSPPIAAQPKLMVSVLVESGQIGWFGSAESGGTNAKLHVVALCGS